MGQDEIFEIIVRDCFGAKLESFKIMKQDFPKVARLLCNKFGLKLDKETIREDRDLDWAK